MTGATTLQPTNMSLKAAASACSGTLGSLTFSLGHIRVSESPGVVESTGAMDANGKQIVTYKNTKTGQMAVVTVHPHSRSVEAKNLQGEETHVQYSLCISPRLAAFFTSGCSGSGASRT